MPTAASIATLRHGFDGILAVSSKLAQDVLVLVLHFVEVGLSACPKVKGLQKGILGYSGCEAKAFAFTVKGGLNKVYRFYH